MNIVIPMAGRGARFAKANAVLPKPLVDVGGQPMYARAAQSVPLASASNAIFVCLKEHIELHGLREDIQKRFGSFNIQIVEVDGVTDGQPCTVLQAKPFIDTDEPLLIIGVGSYVECGLGMEFKRFTRDADGVLSVFSGQGEALTYARVGADGFVKDIAEQYRIGEWASTGLFHFSRGRDFVRVAEAAVLSNERSGREFHIAPLMNDLIAEGARITIDKANQTWLFRTPEDVSHFEVVQAEMKKSA